MEAIKKLFSWYDSLVDGFKWYIDGISMLLACTNFLLFLNAWVKEKKAFEMGIDTINKMEYRPGAFPIYMVFFIIVIPLLPFLIGAMRNVINLFTFQAGREKYSAIIMTVLCFFFHYQFIKMAIEFTPKI